MSSVCISSVTSVVNSGLFFNLPSQKDVFFFKKDPIFNPNLLKNDRFVPINSKQPLNYGAFTIPGFGAAQYEVENPRGDAFG